MRAGYTFPNGWTLRNKYPFYHGPTTYFVLEHEDGAEHTCTIDNALLTLDSPAWRHLSDWMTTTTGLTIPQIAAAASKQYREDT